MVLWVAFEEFLLIEQAKGQAFKALIKPLEVLLTVASIDYLSKVPIEDIPRVEDLLLLHLLRVAPDA